MTDDERAAIRARLDAITPAPWQWIHYNYGNVLRYSKLVAANGKIVLDDGSVEGEGGATIDARGADAAFIANAPDVIAALLDENAALRARVAELEDLCCKALDGIDEYWCTLPENENTMKELFLLNKAKGRPLEMGQGMFDTKKRLFPDESEATE